MRVREQQGKKIKNRLLGEIWEGGGDEGREQGARLGAASPLKNIKCKLDGRSGFEIRQMGLRQHPRVPSTPEGTAAM